MLQARRATRDDLPFIDQLIEKEYVDCVKKFGKFNVSNLIETSILAVVVVNERDDVVAFSSFMDAPPSGLQQSDLVQDKWPVWFGDNFRNDNFNVSNTVWLTFFIADESCEKDAGDRILQTVFSTLAYLEGILALIPVDTPVFQPVADMFESLPLTDDEYLGPKAFACPRSFFIPPLHIRAARIEDHDDLVPIFDQQSEVLTSIYGEFFLAELIESQNEHNYSLVAEVNERAVGLMNVTDEIDVRLLQKCFDLSLFDNLCKPREKEEPEEEAEEEKKKRELTENEIRLGEIFDTFAGKKNPFMAKDQLLAVVESFVNGLEVTDDVGDNAEDDEESKVITQAKAAFSKLEEATQAVAEDQLNREQFVEVVFQFSSELDNLPLLVGTYDFLEANAQAAREELGEEQVEETVVNVENASDDGNGSMYEGDEADNSDDDALDEELIKSAQENCFSITIFCLDIETGFEARGINFLTPAFELFPDREYCLLTLPHTAEESQLLTHFTKVAAAEHTTFGHMLYLLHRDSVSCEVGVEWARHEDMAEVRNIVSRMSNAPDMLDLMMAGIENRTAFLKKEAEAKQSKKPIEVPAQVLGSFVVTCFGQVVGLVVAETQPFLEELQREFAVEDYISFSNLSVEEGANNEEQHANVRFFVLNPLFQSQVRLIFRETLRLFKRKVLYYRHYPTRPLQDVLDIFVQVRPRKIPQQSLSLTVHDNSPLPGSDAATAVRLTDEEKAAIAKDKADTETARQERANNLFALHLLTPRLLAQPKTTINSRVVVVGASTTALSFLESLLLVPDLNYTNITLLSPGGLPAGRLVKSADGSACEQFLPWSLHYDCNRMKQLSMESRIRIVPDILADLDCDHKCVTLSDGSQLAYDFLVLTPGLQDQTLTRLKIQDPEVADIEGVFSLSNEEQMPEIMDFVEIHRPEVYLIFGCSLTALTVIKGLMDMGVPMNSVLWAHPEPEDSTSWSHGDKAVADRVLTTLGKLGVRVMPCAELLEVRYDNSRLTHVVLQSNEPDDLARDDGEEQSSDAFVIACQCLIGCDQKDVDRNIFDAVQKNSLVYDGRMVVDATFATADSSVFAAGTFAKFSRRYGSSLPMERYDSREIGQKLADSVLQQIDPAFSAAYMEARSRYSPPQLGVLPHVEEAILPGPLYYFYSVKPCLHPVKKAKVIVTNQNDRLCRLVFDDNENLRSITYIGSEPIQTENLAALVGLPSSYMNRILFRYANNQIPDLVTFLQEPWATALYHESFPDLRNELKAEVYERREHLSGLIERYLSLQKQRDNGEPIDPASVPLLVNGMPQSIKETIQIKLLHFLEFHANHLPGYQIPTVVPEPPGDR